MRIESRRAEDATRGVEGDPVFLAAGSAARGDYRCAECGYGIIVRAVLPECPMCRGAEWERPSTSPHGPARA